MRLGELCAGYGGLGMAIEEVFGATTAWFSEFDADPSRILAHHWPDVPNHGDMTKIDWAAVESVDIISGGTPCQDLSAAGKRKGMTEGTRSNLWVNMREAIAIQRPRYVAWENVRGAYSATAASDLEQCSGCMGDAGDGGTVLRALGRVLGDLSDLGYDTQWRGVRAGSDRNDGFGVEHAGSCHSRFRVFVLAANPKGQRWGEGRAEPAGIKRGLHAPISGHPSVADAGRSGLHWGQDLEGGGWDARLRGEAINHLGDGDTSRSEATSYADSRNDDGWLTDPQWQAIRRIAAAWSSETNWGEYEPAIRRWEFIIGRPAPRPTGPTGRNGAERLSPRFVEWMMGLPLGWVTDPLIGISHNAQLKALGNGVVPQQAVMAFRSMLAAFQANWRLAA